MKVLHIHAKSNADVLLPKEELEKLPRVRLGVATTIQHLHKIDELVRQVKARLAGQILGCNVVAAEKIAGKVDAFLFVGSGVFHPIQIALRTGKPVWLWNPVTRAFGKLDEGVVKRFVLRKKSALTKFLHAKKVGIIVSTKPGQENLARALWLKAQAKRLGKEFYLFACDTLDAREFENFPFIEFWVNTACPRIPDEALNIVNIDDLVEAGILKLKSRKGMVYET